MIHSTAVIDPTARIGRDVSIGPYSVIEADTEVGDGCVLSSHVAILRYTTLGAGCRIHAGAVLGDLPQDLGFKGGESKVVIGAQCVIREGVTIHRGTKPGTTTTVGDRCFLMGHSHFAHNVTLGSQVIVVNGALLAGYVCVGDRAFISGNCLVHQFTRIGRVAMLGGGCGVSKDVPPFCTVRPLSVNRLAGLNVVGMRRAGLDPEARSQVREAFKLLYRGGMNVSQAAVELRRRFTSGPAAEFAEFIEASRRGLCGLARDESDDGETGT